MFKNYIKIAIRNLLKQKYFTSINIIGLALGITAAVMIYLWISHEISFDRHHKNYENIYRVTTNASMNGQQFDVCHVPSALARKYAEVCPEVEKTAKIAPYFEQVFKYKERNFKEEKVILADTGFFQLFSFSFLEGNPERPFNDENSVILTESVAKRIFGSEKALGQVLFVDEKKALTVSAVIEDMPLNSHNQFGVALYFNLEDIWNNFNWMIYVQFIDGFSKEKAKNTLQEIVDSDIVPVLAGLFGTTTEKFAKDGNYINLDLQPLASIHLESDLYGELEPSGSKTNVTFFSIIALFILVIAGINYMNLSITYYDNRRMEFGIKKANGATPGILIRQFLFESVLISLAAYFISVILIKTLLPVFTHYLQIEINEKIAGTGYFLLLLLLLALALGLLSGLYPSLLFARYKTTSILRNKIKSASKKTFNVRSVLVIVQFTITIAVIVASLLVKKQLNFLHTKELGFNKEHLLVIEGAQNIDGHKETFKNELEKNSKIINVCFSDTYPGEAYGNINNYGVQELGPSESIIMKAIGTDANLFDTYEMEIMNGRKFNVSDKNGVVLNESAVKNLGLGNDPLNYHILFNGNPIPILGVVKDFHHEALNITIDPILIRLTDLRLLNNIIVRVSGSDTKKTIQYINNIWNDISNNMPFEYNFLDEKLRSAYLAEMKVSKVFSLFSILLIIIACMGILGIASFALQRKIKEIGIRKVNGAKVSEVLAMLNKDFIKWVAVAFTIACPIAYYAMNKWLENFAYKTTLSWWIFALAGVLALGIALLTVSWQSWKAATRNPVEALRYE